MGKIVSMKGSGRASSAVVYQPPLESWKKENNPPGYKIFVASTGRCGTLFMSEVMRKIAKIPSFHEPLPWGIGRTCEEVNNVPPDQWGSSTINELRDKARQIEADTINGWYFEASQMFMKTFRPLLPVHEIGMIYLYRNPIEVTLSYAKKCKLMEMDWFLQSGWRLNQTKVSGPLSFHENSLWQWYEMRERYLAMKGQFRRSYEFDFLKLNDSAEWKKMLAHFEIPHLEFDELPDVRKNNIDRDQSQILKETIAHWDVPMSVELATPQGGQYIDFAKRVIAQNSAEVNRA